MRLLLITLLLVCLGAVYGSPFAWEDRGDCYEKCTVEYFPVCARNGNSAPRMFSNECILSNYNCENKTNYIKFKDDEC